MGLKIWLPLHTDFNNIGYSNTTFTASSVSITASSTGKLFDGYAKFEGYSTQRLQASSISTIKSYCFWIKMSVAPSKVIFADRVNRIAFGFSQDGYGIVSCGGRAIRKYTDMSDFINGDWNHIILVDIGSNIVLYINGKKQQNSGDTDYWNHGSGLMIGNRSTYVGYTAFQMQDFRGYDHALSESEVKEISKGLFLHYKLDSIQDGMIDSSGYNLHGTFLLSQPSLSDDTACYNKSINISQDNTQGVNSVNVTSSSSLVISNFTFSCWIKRGYTEAEEKQIYLGALIIRINSSFGLQLQGKLSGNKTWTVSTGSATIPYNEWTHIAVTINYYTIKAYINGNLSATYTTSTSITRMNYEHHFFAESSNKSFIGNVSDIRLYATSLSEADIKELYNVKAKIDKNYKVISKEFIETDSSEENISISLSNGLYSESITFYTYSIAISPAPRTSRQSMTTTQTRRYNASSIYVDPSYNYKLNLSTNYVNGTSVYSYTSSYWTRRSSSSGYTKVTNPRTYISPAKLEIYLNYYDSSSNLIKSQELFSHTNNRTSSSSSNISGYVQYNGQTYNLEIPANTLRLEIKYVYIGALSYSTIGTLTRTSYIPVITSNSQCKLGEFIEDGTNHTEILSNSVMKTNSIIET